MGLVVAERRMGALVAVVRSAEVLEHKNDMIEVRSIYTYI